MKEREIAREQEEPRENLPQDQWRSEADVDKERETETDKERERERDILKEGARYRDIEKGR